jgi:hypothetical protein
LKFNHLAALIICPKFEDEKLSGKFAAEMELLKIDPWNCDSSQKSVISATTSNVADGMYVFSRWYMKFRRSHKFTWSRFLIYFLPG